MPALDPNLFPPAPALPPIPDPLPDLPPQPPLPPFPAEDAPPQQVVPAPPGGPGWVDRLLSLRDRFIAIGDRILRRIAGEPGWEPGIDGDQIKELIGVVIDSDDARHWAATVNALPRFVPLYYNVLKPWTVWCDSLHDGRTHDLSCLLCVRQALEAFRTQHWSAANTGGTHSKSDIGVGVPGLQGALGSSVGNEISKTAGASWDIAQYVVPTIQLLDLCIHFTGPTEVLSTAEILDLWVRGQLTDAEAEVRVRLNGGVWEEAKRTFAARTERAQSEQYIEYARRNGLGADYIATRLKERGVSDPFDQQVITTLYDELPTIQDHLHWLQRNVYDLGYVRDFYLLEGFADDATVNALQGGPSPPHVAIQVATTFWGQFGADLRALGYTQQRAANDYAAHWILPAPGQLAEMKQRLRAGRVPDDLVFTTDQYLRSLAEQDVAPFYRKRFEAISYNVVTLRYVKSLVRFGRITVDEADGFLQDQGYRPDQSRLLAEAIEIESARQNATQGHGFPPPVLAKLLAEDSVTEQFVRDKLTAQGYTGPQQDELIERVRVEQKAVGVQLIVKAVHSGYHSGAIDTPEAQRQLVAAGLEVPRILMLMEDWAKEGQARRNPASRAELIQWLRDGLLSVQEFATRARFLGFTEDDVARIVTETSRGLTAAAAKARAAAAQKAAAAASQLAKVQAAMAQKRAAVQAHLAKLRAQEVNTQEHAQFSEQQILFATAAEEALSQLTDKGEIARAKSAIKYAGKYDSEVLRRAEHLGLLAAEGAPLPIPSPPSQPQPVQTEAVAAGIRRESGPAGTAAPPPTP